MTRHDRGRGERVLRRARALLAAGVAGFALATIAFFAAGLILPAVLATIAGLAAVAGARSTRPPHRLASRGPHPRGSR